MGIMTDPDHLLHANGHFMQVSREPLREAVARIAAAYGTVTSIRRMTTANARADQLGAAGLCPR